MLPALLMVLPIPLQQVLLGGKAQEQNTRRIASLEALLREHPEFKEILIDATEQEVPKPKDKLARKQRYSGKRKKHTLKTQALVSNRRILHLSRHVPGSVNDLTVLRASDVLREVPCHLVVRLDRGYEGVELEYPELTIEKPIRGRRNHLLTPLGKVYNQVMNSLRIEIKHVFAHIQKFRLLAGIYRGRIARYDETFLAIAGLTNFRVANCLSW